MSERRSELKAVAAGEALAAKLPQQDFVKLTAQWVEGWNQVNGRLISFAQSSLRNSLAAAEQLRAVQSPSELLDVQAKLARQAYDESAEEARKLGELVLKLSTDTLGSFAPGK